MEIHYDLSAIPDLGLRESELGSITRHEPFHAGETLIRNSGDGILWVGEKACTLWRAPNQDAPFDESTKGPINPTGTLEHTASLVPKNSATGGGLAQALFDNPFLVPEAWKHEMSFEGSGGLIFWGTEGVSLSGKKTFPILRFIEEQLVIGMMHGDRSTGKMLSVIAI